MKILLISLNFFPDLTGIGKYNSELVRFLSNHGDEVRVITAPPYYPQWRVEKPFSSYKYAMDEVWGAKTFRCPIYVPKNITGKTRLVHLASFALSSFPIILWQIFWKPEVVLVIEPSLLYAPAAILLSKLSKAMSVLHIQDFEIDAAFDLNVLKGGSGIKNFAFNLEKWIMTQFNVVSSISHKMLEKLDEKGISLRTSLYFPNWVDVNFIRPLSEPSIFRKMWVIQSDKIVVLYSGSVGKKQGLDTLLDAAENLSDDKNIQFIICAQGLDYRKLIARGNGINNVRFYPLQPLDLLPELLGLADIQVLIQRDKITDLVLPSKLSGMLASGKPVIATTHIESELGKIINQCGVIVQPENAILLAEAIKTLAYDIDKRSELGSKGRAWVIKNWNSDNVLGNFRGILSKRFREYKKFEYFLNDYIVDDK